MSVRVSVTVRVSLVLLISITVSVRVSATVRVSCIFLIWAGADGAADAVFLRTRHSPVTGHFAYGTLRLLDSSLTVWSFRLLDTLPTGHFAYETFHLLDISPTAWTVRLQILHI